MDIAALSSTKLLRKNVLKWMCLCFGFVSLFFAAFNIFLNNFALLGCLEIALSVFCAYTYYRLNTHALEVWQSVAMCVFVTFVIVLGSYLAKPINGVYVWSFALPVLYYLLLGKRYGIILSALLFILQGAILLTKSSQPPLTTLNFSLNLAFVYISIWAISHVFEGSRALSSKRLKNLALLDPLTGAANRLSMNHYFEVELKDKSQLYLFLLDLDFFKQVNDTYGHAVGDKVLIEVATLLRVVLAKGYVFRVGGEEFALLHSFASQSDALAMAETIRAKLNESAFGIDGLKINVSASIGVVKYRQGDTLEKCITKADEQLYKAKEYGRNKVYFQSDIHAIEKPPVVKAFG